VKPDPQFEDSRFPRIDYSFQARSGRWHNYGGSDDNWNFRRHNLGREYLIEAARERAKEMVVLGVLLLAAAWPTILVMIEVARLYKSRH
jgi:hypothetical protein